MDRPLKRKLTSQVKKDDLLKRLRAGDEAAMVDAVNLYGDDVYYLALGLLNEHQPGMKLKLLDMGEGLMKDVFTACFEKKYYLYDPRGLREILMDLTLLIFLERLEESNSNEDDQS